MACEHIIQFNNQIIFWLFPWNWLKDSVNLCMQGYLQIGQTLYLDQNFHHHIHSYLGHSVHVNKPSHLCLLPSTWPQSDGLLETSVCADWQWAQPGQRPESSVASWPSHTMWSWLIIQNRCPLKQQRRKGEMYWKRVLRSRCQTTINRLCR